MTAPLTRDQEIELMIGAGDRMKAYAARWAKDPDIRKALLKPAPGQDDTADRQTRMLDLRRYA